MERTIQLPQEEIEKIKDKINHNKPFELELRKGVYGGHPYQEDGFGTLVISEAEEKETLFKLALMFLDPSFGIQSICYEIDPKTNSITNMLNCFVDFYTNQDKEDFIQTILSFKSQYLDNFISKIRTNECTQIIIYFPSLY